MFLVFSLALLVVVMGILTSVYSVFSPFMENLWNVSDYQMAYYGAVSSVERAELALRYRTPWFIWSWWFTWVVVWTAFGPLSDYTTGFIAPEDHWFRWTINSRSPLLSWTLHTYTIPGEGMGNVDPMISDDSNYNELWYTDLETFLLSYDTTSTWELYYTWDSTLVFFSGDTVTWVFRLPPKLYTSFGDLCATSVGAEFDSQCDPDGDGLYDDSAVVWTLEWLYKTNGFKIFPTMSAFYYQSNPTVNTSNDNVIRESIINETGVITFDDSVLHRYTPISNGSDIWLHNVVAQDATEIENQKFSNIFTSTDFSDIRLSFGAANLFRTATGTIYPYLEYQFTFPQPIADRFYTIEWHSRIGDYDVQIVIKKPTVEWTIGGDFTVIF